MARERAPRSARGPWADTGGPQEVDGGCVEPGEAQHAWPGSRRAGRAERVEGRSRKPARGPPRAPRPPRPSSRCLPRPRSPPRAARPAPAALLAPARLRPLRPPGSAGGAGGGKCGAGAGGPGRRRSGPLLGARWPPRPETRGLARWWRPGISTGRGGGGGKGRPVPGFQDPVELGSVSARPGGPIAGRGVVQTNFRTPVSGIRLLGSAASAFLALPWGWRVGVPRRNPSASAEMDTRGPTEPRRGEDPARREGWP